MAGPNTGNIMSPSLSLKKVTCPRASFNSSSRRTVFRDGRCSVDHLWKAAAYAVMATNLMGHEVSSAKVLSLDQGRGE